MTDKTPAAIAADIIIQALQDAKDNAVTPAVINAMDRALTVAKESGVLIGLNGTPVADLLDTIYHAMPTPKSNKLSEAWSAASSTVYRPRYRIVLDQPSVVLTDTASGVQRYWPEGDETTVNARDIFAMTDSGAPPSPLGVGVCGRNEELAQELIERNPA